MICPECKAEYRQGFTRCSDCDVDLVYALPDAQNLPEAPEGLEGMLRSVWGGSDPRMCAELCAKLKDAEIPFKVVRREDHVFNTRNYPDQQIAVPPSLYDKALDLLGDPDELERADEAEADAHLGLPAQDDAGALGEGEDDWEPGNWYPEDATVELWSEGSNRLTWMIESSLRENHIHSRTDALEDGSRKVFVLSEDETRAREIVREITEAAPPD
jgi:hypothetical protein